MGRASDSRISSIGNAAPMATVVEQQRLEMREYAAHDPARFVCSAEMIKQLSSPAVEDTFHTRSPSRQQAGGLALPHSSSTDGDARIRAIVAQQLVLMETNWSLP